LKQYFAGVFLHDRPLRFSDYYGCGGSGESMIPFVLFKMAGLKDIASTVDISNMIPRYFG
jgi:hypothetical protein